MNNSKNQLSLPEQKTPLENLALAGAHTKTEVDVWSIEAAVESALRAVKIFEPDVRIIPQYNPKLFRIIGKIDNIFFRCRLPHLFDLILMVGIVYGIVRLFQAI